MSKFWISLRHSKNGTMGTSCSIHSYNEMWCKVLLTYEYDSLVMDNQVLSWNEPCPPRPQIWIFRKPEDWRHWLSHKYWTTSSTMQSCHRQVDNAGWLDSVVTLLDPMWLDQQQRRVLQPPAEALVFVEATRNTAAVGQHPRTDHSAAIRLTSKTARWRQLRSDVVLPSACYQLRPMDRFDGGRQEAFVCKVPCGLWW